MLSLITSKVPRACFCSCERHPGQQDLQDLAHLTGCTPFTGRLWKSKYLRKKGEVRYNGHSRREFNMARAIAMVDQIDQHIANLTVRETLEFAHICQVGAREL